MSPPLGKEANSASTHANIVGWPLLIVLTSTASTFVEAIVSHSYGTIAAFVNTRKDTPLWLTGIVAPMPVAAAAFFLQLSMSFMQRHRTFFRFSGMVGHLLLCLSNFTSAFVEPPYALFAVTYGIIYSLGALLVLGNANLICGEYFPTTHTWHVLGTSLPMLGWPLGAAIGNPLLSFLMSAVGVKRTFFILSVINVVFALTVTLLLKPVEQPFCPKCISITNPKLDGEDIHLVQQVHPTATAPRLCVTLQDIRNNPCIPLWLLAKFLGSLGWFSLRTNLVAYGKKYMQLNLWHSSLAMSLYAWCEVVIAIVLTLISNRLKDRLNLIHLVAASLLAGVSLVLFFLSPSYKVVFFIIAGILGFGIQLFMEFTYPASEEVMRLGLFQSYGLTSVFLGVAVLCSPVSGGLILELLAHVPQTFFLVQVIQWTVVAGLHLACLLIMRRRPREAIVIELTDTKR